MHDVAATSHFTRLVRVIIPLLTEAADNHGWTRNGLHRARRALGCRTSRIATTCGVETGGSSGDLRRMVKTLFPSVDDPKLCRRFLAVDLVTHANLCA